MSKIKVQYFSISSQEEARPLLEIFQELQGQEIAQRAYTSGYMTVRLENIQPITSAGRNYWLLRFTRLRSKNWPGVARVDAEATDLNLAPNSMLAEDTFSIFDLENNKVAIQYNHFGVRHSKIQDYINIMGQSPYYSLLPVLNNNVLDKYAGKPIVTKVEAVIDGISDADVANFEGSSLSNVIQENLEADVQRVVFGISVDARFEENKIQKNFVTNFINKVLARGGEKDSLKVTVKDDEDSSVEELDLFEDLKVTYIDTMDLQETAGNRYEAEGFNNQLILAMNAWH